MIAPILSMRELILRAKETAQVCKPTILNTLLSPCSTLYSVFNVWCQLQGAQVLSIQRTCFICFMLKRNLPLLNAGDRNPTRTSISSKNDQLASLGSKMAPHCHNPYSKQCQWKERASSSTSGAGSWSRHALATFRPYAQP